MLLALFLWACDTTTTETTPACTLDMPVLTPTSATPGLSVTVQATPLTTQWDSAVTIGSSRAEILDFNRDGCDECDLCVTANECTVCGDCDSCADLCASCVETITVAVPQIPPGSWPVTVINHHGRSAAATLTVEAGDTSAVGN